MQGYPGGKGGQQNWQNDPSQAAAMGVDLWHLNGGKGVGGYGDPWRQRQPWENYYPMNGMPVAHPGPWSDSQPGMDQAAPVQPPVPPPPTAPPQTAPPQTAPAVAASMEVTETPPPSREAGTAVTPVEPAAEPNALRAASTATEDPAALLARAFQMIPGFQHIASLASMVNPEAQTGTPPPSKFSPATPADQQPAVATLPIMGLPPVPQDKLRRLLGPVPPEKTTKSLLSDVQRRRFKSNT